MSDRTVMPAEGTPGGDDETDVPPRGGVTRALPTRTAGRRRHWQSTAVPAPVPGCPGCGDRVIAERILEEMAAALRELRGHVPDHAWWDSGAAATLLEYQARYGLNGV